MIEVIVCVIIGAYSYYVGYKTGIDEATIYVKKSLWVACKELSPEAYEELTNILKRNAR